MRVHVVGLGKLGLPIALAIEQAGHQVSGWDIDPRREKCLRESLGQPISSQTVPEIAHEPFLGMFLERSNLRLRPLSQEDPPDMVLVCVQTPHEPRFEGVTPLEDPPQDFDYVWLQEAVRDVAERVYSDQLDPLVVTVSTCLPGTFRRYIKPLLGGQIRYAYMPLFIAMGSVIEDFRHPEFVLVGSDDGQAPSEILGLCRSLYGTVWGQPPIRSMSITSAELTKVAYNAFIGFKLMLANGVAMTCDAVGADADDVMGSLKLADKRLVGPAYLTPGMGDGGGCHPRDQIALSWLADELELHDPFEPIIRHREAHARWLAEHLWRAAMDRGLPPVILGRAYKPNSTLATGSHALLVQHYVTSLYGYPVVAQDEPMGVWPEAAYLLATPHDHFVSAPVPEGSVVVDPWGLYRAREGVDVIRLGRRERKGSADEQGGGDVGVPGVRA